MFLDVIKSGIGGEKTDSTILAVNLEKPLWNLTPLPLSQVNRSAFKSRSTSGRISSLQHASLQVISRNFHLYDPESLQGMSSILLKRVFDRLNLDRRYGDSEYATCKPDETTLWFYNLLADSDYIEEDHTLSVPINTTISHFSPQTHLRNPTHPFTEIPKLYGSLQPQADYHLITSLRLDGVDGHIDDRTILNLKWCTHLTVLWTLGCSNLTDAGIKLLESSLVLPGQDEKEEGRGMWRLRCWFLSGCKQVGDKSMRSFARWPGLVLLDVRNTSCTSSGISIFNRTNQNLFRGRIAHMQPCTSGLRALFDVKVSSAVIISKLAQTILPTSGSVSTYQYRSLNLIPSHSPIPLQYLPDPTPSSSNLTKYHNSQNTDKSTYRAGMGQLYGSGVRTIENETLEFRRDVKTALYMQALDAGLTKKEPLYKKEKKKTKKALAAEKRLKKGYKIKKNHQADDRGKRFYMNHALMRADEGFEDVKGEKEFMLVRMSDEGWDKLSWNTVIVPDSQPRSVSMSQSQSQRSRKADLLGDILGIISSTRQPDGYIWSSPSRTQAESSSIGGLLGPRSNALQSSSPVSSHDSLPITPQISTQFTSNPFSLANRASNEQSSAFMTFKATSTSDNTFSQHDPTDGFDLSRKKRRFGGDGESGGTRRGLKMFTGASL